MISTDSQQLAHTTFVQCIGGGGYWGLKSCVCACERHALLAQTTDSPAGLLPELTWGMFHAGSVPAAQLAQSCTPTDGLTCHVW
jgi:hypothetical protein